MLIAYDGSADGHAALTEAADIAVLSKAEVTLLAVIDVNVDEAAAEAYASGTAITNQFEQTKAVLDQEMVRLRQRGITGSTVVAYGRPAEQIADKAREIGADIVVIGHRSHGLWSLWTDEAVGPHLLKELPCSLLVVPPKA